MASEKKEPRENPFMKDKSNEEIAKTIGQGDQKSRSKAEKNSEQANEEIKRQNEEPLAQPGASSWPVGVKGTPMMHAEMSAAELIPTGQYANVSIGPCRLHFLIDPDRDLAQGESYFSLDQRATIAAALNEAAEIVEGDVVAVQRNLVMENMQQQLGND